MTQRYKIVAHKEGIKITHYELWVEHKFLWFSRWYAVPRDENDPGSSYKRFNDLNEVREYIQSMSISREVVEEGTLE